MSFAAQYALPSFTREPVRGRPARAGGDARADAARPAGREREPMSLARLASELALPKSSVHGLCNTLVSFGYLRRQADGAFLIGPRVMSLAEAFVSGTDVAQEFNALWADARRRARRDRGAVGAHRHRGALRRGAQQRAAARPGFQRRHAPAGLPVGQRQGDARAAAAPTRCGASSPAGSRPGSTRKGPRDVEALLQGAGADRASAATASTTRPCAKASTRSARRCSTPRATPSPASRSASTRRCSAPTAASAIATRRSTWRARCRSASAAMRAGAAVEAQAA